MHIRFCIENLRRRVDLGGLGMDEIILKWILKIEIECGD
jgi:hypothetical protein